MNPVRLRGCSRSFLAVCSVWGLLVSAAVAQNSQVWEKVIAPGLVYREEVNLLAPRVVHALRVSLKSPTIAKTQLVGQTVYEEGSLTGRGPVSAMVAQNNAIAGINGDFFNMTGAQSGQPLNLMVRDGELLAHAQKRVAIAWGEEDVQFGFGQFTGSWKSGNLSESLKAFNRVAGKDDLVLNTPSAGNALADDSSTMVVLKTEGAKWSPSAEVKATVETVSAGLKKLAVAAGRAVLVGTGTHAAPLAGLHPGDTVTVSYATAGFDFSKVSNAIGGGSYLVKDGQEFNDAKEEGFGPAFYAKRHPRTAIGRTKDGDLWLVAVDGRQAISIGATLTEMSRIMKRLGCVDAINLDGGGSTTMNVLGITVNRPSDGHERDVANGIVLLNPKQKNTPSRFAYHIAISPTIKGDATPDAVVELTKGHSLANREVIWSSLGAAWIDQGGRLHPLGNGDCTIFAYVDGKTITTKVKVIGAVKPYVQRNGATDHDPDGDPD